LGAFLERAVLSQRKSRGEREKDVLNCHGMEFWQRVSFFHASAIVLRAEDLQQKRVPS
jgi:hypothetical protein